ncbi:Sas10/Utp3/C1D family [Popillia japonica]|uniref:Sas10/Utp3/C1D family n=1 Tax=Popillia japonica TaxID=7064 RepID=A0AAW1N3T9_POPJA
MAPDVTNDNSDLPQALVILSEMNVSAQHVATLVDNMLQRVRDGELTTDQGLSFLEMKYHMLLSYLINLTYVVLRKCSGEKIEGDPCIDRLVEIRTVLEKIRPIDQKLKYQIDKLVKSAVTSTNPDDPTSFKAHPENLLEKSEGDSNSEDSDVDFHKVKTDVYVPPKLSAVHYAGDETTYERNKRLQEKRKKHSLSSSLMQDLKEEYLDIPIEISQSSRAQQIITKQQQERQSYEEEYLTRLPVSKSEKHSRRKLTTLGTLGDEITDFGASKSILLFTRRETSWEMTTEYGEPLQFSRDKHAWTNNFSDISERSISICYNDDDLCHKGMKENKEDADCGPRKYFVVDWSMETSF